MHSYFAINRLVKDINGNEYPLYFYMNIKLVQFKLRKIYRSFKVILVPLEEHLYRIIQRGNISIGMQYDNRLR